MVAPTPRGLTFGSVAERYERFRPGYPDEVVDLLLAEGPADALEVGAGTGKLTRAVAARGLPVTAVEPDPAMCAVLERETAGLPVTVLRSTLEDLAPREPVDLVFAAAAWHWTDPATRWERAARLLRPGGTFACAGGAYSIADPVLDARVEDVVREVVGGTPVASAQDDYATTGVRWPGNELEASPWFAEVRQVELDPQHTMAAEDLVGLYSTVSAFLVLPDAERQAALDRIREILPPDAVVRRDLVVHLARRAEPAGHDAGS